MAILKFDMEGIKKIYEHSQNEKTFLPTFGQLSEAEYLKEGEIMPECGYVNSDKIDFTKIPPAVHLVKDQGTYIMAATVSQLKPENAEPNSTTNFVVYAQGLNPELDDDWWESSRVVMGGDDCVIDVPLEWIKVTLERNQDAKWFRLRISPENIQLLDAA